MNTRYPIILGSGSPRRHTLMEEAGFTFKVIKPDIEETYPSDLDYRSVPEWLARKKAEALINTYSNSIIITADTVVTHRQQVLGKPTDNKEAHTMLSNLSGDSHEVITGMGVYHPENGLEIFSDHTTVVFRELKEQEIDYYISHYEPYDKAGAYGIQEWLGLVAIDRIEGSYFNVMGLAVNQVYEQLVKVEPELL